MVGIAGAVPDPGNAEYHVRLGDIVVSDRNGVVQYDFVKAEPQAISHRNAPRPPGAGLLEAVGSLIAEELQNVRPWEKYIGKGIRDLGRTWKRPDNKSDVLEDVKSKPIRHPTDSDRRNGKPRVFHGTIASANKLLKDSSKRDALRNKFAVRAVEMEGSGIADSAWSLDKEYLVVRGTCDYCNPTKSNRWQKYAAIAAASYARSVIEAMSPSSNPAENKQTNIQPKTPPRKITLKFANINTTFEILFCDLFSLKGLRVIAVSEFFDSQLGNVVSTNSLHGIFLNKHFPNNLQEFDRQVDCQLAGRKYKVVKKSQGKNKSYPIGTSVLIAVDKIQYIVFSLCKADPKTCKADANMAMLVNALDGLWQFARINTNGEPLNLPLVGSGLSGVGIAPRDLLNLIILSAITDSKIKTITNAIRIVLHGSLMSEIDLREIQQHWSK